MDVFMFTTLPMQRFATLAGVLFLVLQEAAFGSLFSVDLWSHDVFVRGNSDQSAIFYETVSNPFINSGQVIDRDSTASIGFDFAWNETHGDFLVQGSHQCVAQNLPPFPNATGSEFCASEGGIQLTTAADLLLTIDTAYSYELAGPNLFTELAFGVSMADNKEWPVVFGTNRVADTFVSFPSVGTLSIKHEIPLLAGQQYFVSYNMRMLAFGNTGAVGTGDGYVHFTLAPVPEPTSLASLALASILLRRRSVVRAS